MIIQFYFLFKASENGQLKEVKKELGKKVNKEAIDKNGYTALICGIFLNEFLFPPYYSIFFQSC